METYSLADKALWPKQNGIYLITCNGKPYVGRTECSFAERWRRHISSLRIGNHANRYLQKAFNKHGERGFQFHVLEVCTSEVMGEREGYWIGSLNAMHYAHGYNLDGSTSNGTKLRSEETKRQISESKKGTKRPDLALRNRRDCKEVMLKSPKGEFVYGNISQVAADIGAHKSAVYKVINGIHLSCNGWTLV